MRKNRQIALWCILICGCLAWLSADAAEPSARQRYDRALTAFYQGDYQRAESEMMTVYRTAPNEPFAADATFKAGEAAYRREAYAAAVTHFEHYLRNYPTGAAIAEVRRRLEQAREKAGDQALPLPRVRREERRPLVAWLGRLAQTDDEELARLASSLASNGYNALAVDAYRLPGRPAHRLVKRPPLHGAYFATQAAPVCGEVLPRMVAAAHKADLELIAVLPTRAIPPREGSENTERRWDRESKMFVADERHRNLFDEGEIKQLAARAEDLARAGVDEIWLDRDLAIAPGEGMSEQARNAATVPAGGEIDWPATMGALPAEKYAWRTQGLDNAAFAALRQAQAGQINHAVETIVAAIRKAAPGCRIGLALPLPAPLEQNAYRLETGLDLNALASKRIDRFVACMDWHRWRTARGLTRQEGYDSMSRLSAQLLALTGSAKRGIVAFDTTMSASGRLLPTWEIRAGVGRLTSAAPFGVALTPFIPRKPITEILNRAAQADEEEDE